uniref:ATP synthase complex subunit 8 n=1 Tax=Phycosecis limbata TaxID=1205668 RepID=A0A0S2MR73_9CUCU|nr:ATP synthase F0 subunit 8 [Phycosecis limbata]
MPQMAPLSWLTLFISFTIIFLLLNSMNYFCFNYKTNLINKNFTKKHSNNWKW